MNSEQEEGMYLTAEHDADQSGPYEDNMRPSTKQFALIKELIRVLNTVILNPFLENDRKLIEILAALEMYETEIPKTGCL